MKDLIINKPAVKKKWGKQKKTKNIAETTKTIGENQPAWLVTLKKEIVELK
jgi:hypothetical protein